MPLEDKVYATHLLALHRTEELGNVSAADRELDISHVLLYSWLRRYRQYGRDWLHPNRYAVRRGRPHGLPALDERAILALLLSVPQGLVSTPCNWLSSNVPWPRARANTPCGISSTICCRSTRQPDGHFSESSPTEAGIFGVTADKLESGLLFRQLGGAPTLMPKMLQNQRSSMTPWCTICSWTERPRISGGAELAGHRRRACLRY